MRRGIAAVVVIFLATRLVVWTAAYAGALIHVRIPLGLEPPFAFQKKEVAKSVLDPASELSRMIRRYVSDFAPLMNWDAPHYQSIIENGYQYEETPPGTPFHEAQYNIAFFPLYPKTAALLVRPLHTVASAIPLTALRDAAAAERPWMSAAAAMILIANVCGLLAAIVFYLWCRAWTDDAAARLAVAVLLCWPTACFFSFGYSESMSLLLTAGMLLLAQRRRFGYAAAACGLATASRPTAIVLVPVLMVAHWLSTTGAGDGGSNGHARSALRRLVSTAAIGVVAASGAIAYGLFLWSEFGAPDVYVKNLRAGWIPPLGETSWRGFLLMSPVWDSFKYIGRAFRNFPVGLIEFTNPITWNMPATLAILFLCIGGWRRTPRSFRPLLLIGPLIFTQRYLVAGWSSFGMESMARYVGLAAPAYLVLGAWCVREWRPAVTGVLFSCLMLIQAAWAFAFGLGEWAG